MKEPICKCFKCPNRRPGCKEGCDQWKEYEVQMIAYKAFVRANKEFERRK
jgi:hypothetical protein